MGRSEQNTREQCLRFQKGFTLFEILVVLGILGGILALGLPRISKNNNNVKKVARELSVLGKEIRHKARLKGRTFRLVIETNKEQGSYWIESGEGPILLKSQKEIENERRLDDKDKPKSPFQKDDSILKKSRELPRGFYFSQVESSYSKDPVTEGLAYVHFLPQGMVEHAAIQITNKNTFTWTIVFNPLTGQTDIFEEAMSIKDLGK